jgi:hypothetical protein
MFPAAVAKVDLPSANVDPFEWTISSLSEIEVGPFHPTRPIEVWSGDQGRPFSAKT